MPVCSTIYPLLEAGLFDSYISQGHWCYLKCKQPHPGFELVTPSPFPMTITIIPWVPHYIYIYIYIYTHIRWSYLPNPSARAGYDTRSIFKRSLTGLNSEFSFSLTSCLTKAVELSLPYYLPIAGGRIIGFIPFSRVLVLCEMQSVSSRIWTRVTMSISYDNNHYTTGTSTHSMMTATSC